MSVKLRQDAEAALRDQDNMRGNIAKLGSTDVQISAIPFKVQALQCLLEKFIKVIYDWLNKIIWNYLVFVANNLEKIIVSMILFVILIVNTPSSAASISPFHGIKESQIEILLQNVKDTRKLYEFLDSLEKLGTDPNIQQDLKKSRYLRNFKSVPLGKDDRDLVNLYELHSDFYEITLCFDAVDGFFKRRCSGGKPIPSFWIPWE